MPAHGLDALGRKRLVEALLFELRKGVMRVQFVEHVAIDIEQVTAVAALSDPMKIPDFVEQRARHCVSTGVFLPI